MSNYNFEADTGKILDIVIHSLYSNKEIFLRELVSNSSDAIDKLRYLALSDKKLADVSDEAAITITADAEAKTLTISDTGIGMSKEELQSSLGTIARSGTKSFLEAMSQAKADGADAESDKLALIGQFGVGFYSAFMVADKVSVLTKKAGTDEAFLWVSDGRSGYQIEEAEKQTPGTQITLHLKEEEGEFCEEMRLSHVIKTYADHISYPITFQQGEDERRLNAASALWTRPKSEISDDDYNAFFADMGAGYGTPLLTLHNVSEGAVSFTNLLCIPEMRPYDLFDPARKPKVKLYINRVFITDDTDALIPGWLRFVRGIIDTSDIDLNVSRELLQHNQTLSRIGKAVVKRIVSELTKLHDKDKEAYDKLWDQFGIVLKEGLYEDTDNREKLLKITRFKTSKSKDWTSLDEIVSRMKEGQETLYTLSAESVAQAEMSPHLEGLKARDLEVIYLTDPVDEFWLPLVGVYGDKSFTSITKGGLDLNQFETEEAPAEEAGAEQDYEALITAMKAELGEAVADVRLSKTLTDSPACLVADENGMDIQMQRLMRQHDPNFKEPAPILEINANHDIVKALQNREKDGADIGLLSDATHLLFEQSLIIEGKSPPNIAEFSARMTRVMSKVVKGH